MKNKIFKDQKISELDSINILIIILIIGAIFGFIWESFFIVIV